MTAGSRTHEDWIDALEELINNPNPLAAFGILSPENVTSGHIDERAEALRLKAFEIYGSLGAEGCNRYELTCERIEANRRQAIRIVTGELPIEEAAANLKRNVTLIGARSIHFWNPWLNALGFGIVASLAAWAAQSLVVGQGLVYAGVATGVNLLLVAMGIYGLVHDRRAMTLFASFAAILPIALVHFSDVLRWLDFFRAYLTPTGNALVVPFAGMVGGIFALLVVRTGIDQRKQTVQEVVTQMFAALPDQRRLKNVLAWNAQEIKRMLAYTAGGLAAGLSVGFALFATLQTDQSNVIAKLSGEKEKLSAALNEEQTKASGLSQEVSRLESEARRADSLASELSTVRGDLQKAKDELQSKAALLTQVAEQRDSLRSDLHAEEGRQSFLKAAVGSSLTFRDDTSPYVYSLSVLESGHARVERTGPSGRSDSYYEKWSWLDPSSIRLDHPYKSGCRLVLVRTASGFKVTERSDTGERELALVQ
jgi:hypothetical protein